MPCYVLDARTATPHFPGIGRYVTNLARAIVPLLAPAERLTVIYDPAHPISLLPADAVQTIPLAVSPFSLRQQWAVPRLLRGSSHAVPIARPQLSTFVGRQIKLQGARSGLEASAGNPGLRESPAKASSPENDLNLYRIYHSPYIAMPYRPGLPTILTVYDLIPLRYPTYSTARARLLIRVLTRLALRTAQHVIAISDFTRRDFMAEFNLAPERITAIPLAADPAFRPQPAEAIAAVRRKYGLPDRFALYLGSNKPHKNLARLVEAWQMANGEWRMANGGLVIAGAWDERYREARQWAADLGNIQWLGPIPDADLPALYAAADVFAFPSLYEGFGLPVLEAMACGTPVVCSNGSSLTEVAGDAALLVDPLDVSALAEALARLWADPALQAELRQRGLAQGQHFSWRTTAQKTLDLYRALARSVIDPAAK